MNINITKLCRKKQNLEVDESLRINDVVYPSRGSLRFECPGKMGVK